MHRLLSFLSSLVAILAVIAVAVPAESQRPLLQASSQRPIDESRVVTLYGNVHPMARPEFDRGEVSAEMRLDRMVLVLKPSATQQAELDALVDAQQQPASSLYHRWLSPQEFGAEFGPSASDVAKISSWLMSHGFSVEPLMAGRQQIIFSGTASQVADAFHTAIHRYVVDGVAHIGNSQEPQIPEALSPMVSGVLSLHDFRRSSSPKKVTEIANPLTTSGTAHYLYPADLAVIYDLTPLYTAGKNGTGASIAIVGRSNINLSDVSAFRSTSALVANQPTLIYTGSNPGFVSGDQDESTLDVEWAGALAPGAKVSLVVGASTATTDGVDLSAQYIVNHKTATIMSTSYGSCEAYMGTTELAFYNSLWEQAASEGISSFVSSGDSGAAGCSSGSASSGSGNAVNGLCSSQYSTCVGGTEFNEGSGSYWNTTNGAGGVSAKSYIPEMVWNESAKDGGSGLWASGGGISQVYAVPTWQKNVVGGASNNMRAVPDVALSAASHDGYLINENGSWYVIAGTSAASPSFASIMAEVVGANSGTGLGNVNPLLYGLVTASLDPFHPTPSGNNTVPGVNGFTASGGTFNLATGLGSVDANRLVTEWPTSAPVAVPSFTLTPSLNSASLQQGKSTTFTIAIAGTNGFSGSVGLAANVPAGVTLSFSPASAKAGSSVTATLTVSSTFAAGSSTITITGTSGTITQTATVALAVTAAPSFTMTPSISSVSLQQGKSTTFTIAIAATNGFSGSVGLAANAPAGVTLSFSPASAKAGSSVTATLSVSSTIAAGNSTITITGTSGTSTQTATVALAVTAAPTFTMTPSMNSVSLAQGKSTSFTIAIAGTGGSSEIVNLTAKSAGGVTLSFSPASAKPGTTVAVTLSVSSTVAIGNSTITISGTSGAISETASVALTVVTAPTLTMSLNASSLTVAQSGTGTLLVTTATGGSYSGAVTLAVTGLPAGVTATWSAGSYTPTVNGSKVTTLTINPASNAALASTSIHITATGDGLSSSAAVTLQISKASLLHAAARPKL